jgi:hypothetical protein
MTQPSKKTYVEELEDLAEAAQDAAAAARSTIDKYFTVMVTSVNQCCSIDLEIKGPPTKSHGMSTDKAQFKQNLAKATITKVDDIPACYVEFCDGTKGIYEVTVTTEALVHSVLKKFALQHVPVMMKLANVNKNGDSFPGGKMYDISPTPYMPYVPIKFPMK